MLSNKFAFAALAAACIAAAGAGGYFASRPNATPAPAAMTAPASTPAPSAAATPAPVQETEAVVGDTSAPAHAPATESAPVKRAEPPARSKPAPAAKPASTMAKRQDPPPLERTWPSSASAPQAQTASSDPQAAPARTDDRPAAEPAAPPAPPQKTFEDLVVSADSVIGLQNETAITSERAKVEDRVEARVTRDVRVGDKVAIPAGSRAIGTVTQVDRGGKFKERARLGIRFHELVLADGTRLPISTETIYRDGQAPGNESAAKIGGGAVGGTIIGAILGGAKGAAIGGLAGAGAGSAVVAAGDRNAATLRAGEPISVRLQSPVTVTTERAER